MRNPIQITFLTNFLICHAEYFSNSPKDFYLLSLDAQLFFGDFEDLHQQIHQLFFRVNLHSLEEVEKKLRELSDESLELLYQKSTTVQTQCEAHPKNYKKIRAWLLDDELAVYNWRFFTAPSEAPTDFKKFLSYVAVKDIKCRNNFEINNDKLSSSFADESEMLAYCAAIKRCQPHPLINFLYTAPKVAAVFTSALPDLIKLADHFYNFLCEEKKDSSSDESDTFTVPLSMN